MAQKTWSVELAHPEQMVALKQALAVLAQTDAPFLRAALEESGRIFSAAAGRRTHQSIAAKIAFVGLRATKTNIKAIIKMRHPGSASREFGRKYYYRDFTGRRQRATGTRIAHSPGQREQPFVGLKHNDAAIGETHEQIGELITTAFSAEWDRILGGAA